MPSRIPQSLSSSRAIFDRLYSAGKLPDLNTRLIVQGLLDAVYGIHTEAQERVYVAVRTLEIAGGKRLAYAQVHPLWNELKRIISAARQSTPKSAGRTKQQKNYRRWRAILTASELWGLDVFVHYGWLPSKETESSTTGGIRWADCLRSAALATRTWDIACPRLNQILARRWQEEDSRKGAANQTKSKPSQFAEASCPVRFTDLVQLINWDKTGSTPLLNQEVNLALYNCDRFGLVLSTKSNVDGSDVAMPCPIPADPVHTGTSDLVQTVNEPSTRLLTTEPLSSTASLPAVHRIEENSVSTLSRMSNVNTGLNISRPTRSTLRQADNNDNIEMDIENSPGESNARKYLPTDEDFEQNFSAAQNALIGCLQQMSTELSSQPAQAHIKCAMEWLLNATEPAGITVQDLKAGCFQGDVYVLSSGDIYSMLDEGFIFDRPVVVRDKFKDSGIYSIPRYCEQLQAQFEHLENQGYGSGTTAWAETTTIIESMNSAAMPTNILNLRNFSKADLPLFIRHPRYQLLSVLDGRQSEGPGKRVWQRPCDVTHCEAFDLFASPLAFSGAHVDVLSGTYVRNLAGLKAWLFATDLNEDDWKEFEHMGQTWVPPYSKVRVQLLRPDDVFFMPPGVRIIHAPLTISPCVMTGGMLWDTYNIPATLRNVKWACKNPRVTNEPIPLQLRATVDALQEWLIVSVALSRGWKGDITQHAEIREQIKDIRSLGCTCTGQCLRSCECLQRGSRCTDLCAHRSVAKRRPKCIDDG